MATSYLLILYSLLTLLRHSIAAQWSITQYNIEVITTSTGRYATTITYTDTSTYRLYPPVSPTPTGSATSTSTSSDAVYDIEYTTLYLPASAVAASQLASLTASTTSTAYTYSSFVMDIVYTAPATCASKFAFTTSTSLYVPVGAATNLSPTRLVTSASGLGTTHVTGYLPANAVTISSTRTNPDFVQRFYINSCSTPGGRYVASPSSGTVRSGGDSYPNDYSTTYFDCLGSLCPYWLIYIVVIIPILAFLFLGGLIESYYWFTRLMKGQFALRGVPIMWVAISLWTLCCLRRHRSASPAQQPQLLKQWREMSTGTHIKLWLKYGFRHRDPPQLAQIIGKQPVVPVWQSYPPPNYSQAPPGAPGVGGPGMDGQQMQQQQQQQQGAPVYYQQPQSWQGAQVWSPYPPGQQPPPNAQNPHGPPQPNGPYPPPTDSRAVSSYYSGPGSLPPTSSPQNGYMYPPPPQQPGDHSSFAPTTSTSPAPEVAGAPMGALGGAAGAVAAAPSSPREQEHGTPQQVQAYSPPSEQQLQPAPEVIGAGHPGNGGERGGGEGAPEVVVERQVPKSDGPAH